MNVECAMDAKGRSGRDVGNEAVRVGMLGRAVGDLGDRGSGSDESEEMLSEEDEDEDAESGEGEDGV